MAGWRFELASNLRSDLTGIARRVMSAAADFVAMTARRRLTQSATSEEPRQSDAVVTAQTVQARVEMQGGEVVGIVEGGGALVFLEFGTAPHRIEPRHPMEALDWPDAAHPVAYVDHPGTEPKPVLRPALQDLPQFLQGGGV